MKTYNAWGLQDKETGKLLLNTICKTRREARDMKLPEDKTVKVECKTKETI